MKFAIIFALFALSTCTSPVSNEEFDLQTTGEIIDILKCLLDKSVPLIPEVVQLIDAFKAKDLAKLVEIIQNLFKEGKEVYLDCFTQDIERFGVHSDVNCLKGCEITFLAVGVSACSPLIYCLTRAGLAACIAQVTMCASSVPTISGACGKCITY